MDRSRRYSVFGLLFFLCFTEQTADIVDFLNTVYGEAHSICKGHIPH